nr:unnamed protein product [Callosobruchus analis]
MGIYSEDQEVQIYRKLPDHTAICTAETLAIREAVRIMGKRTDKLAVITDSLSALQAITKQGIDKDQDYITLGTREEIISAEYDCNIKLIWVPSHPGIAGNEQADRLAQKGRDQNRVHQNNDIPGRRFLGMIKDKLWNQWITRHKNWEQNKGQHYADIQPYRPRTPWFYNTRYKGRAQISTIIRMRTNHGSYAAHLYKIGAKGSPNCCCGEYGSLDHIVFNCNANPQLGETCYRRAAEEEKGPANIKALCKNPTSKALTYIVKEITRAKMKI